MSKSPCDLADLIACAASLPERIRAAPADGPQPSLPAAVRSVVTTGVGSSAAQARLLASILSEVGPIPGRFVATEALSERIPHDCGRDLLVVFSQGLSPNARLALARPDAFARSILVTSAAASPARRDALPALDAAGVEIHDPGAGEEFGTLMRIAGPMLGTLAALVIARDIGAPIPLEREAAAAAVADAFDAGRLDGARLGASLGELALSIVTPGWHAERCDNLRLKLVEGLLTTVPPVCDALDLAHGPLQVISARPALLLAPSIGSADAEAALDRVEACLDPARQTLLRYRARLPGPAAVLEHEAWMNGIVLEGMLACGIDPARWPGKDRDAPIYERGANIVPAAATPTAGARQLPDQTWPEVEAALGSGATVALVPLGSTEQHGPHLPFSTDTTIAEALAARWAARWPEAVALPPLALGCASEHLGFPGTLSLAPDTFVAMLGDVLASLSRHGFEEAVVFSAHGGNLKTLREAARTLSERAAPTALRILCEHGPVNARLHEVAAGFGVSEAEAGQHAGELETSILLHLRPDLVRRAALAAGRTGPPMDGHALFYPDLRKNAPSGVVGDPRSGDAARGAIYLDAWVDALDAFYRDSVSRDRHQTNGTKKA